MANPMERLVVNCEENTMKNYYFKIKNNGYNLKKRN